MNIRTGRLVEQEVDGSGSCIGLYVQGGAPWNLVPRSGYLSVVCALFVAEHMTCDINFVRILFNSSNQPRMAQTAGARSKIRIS